jgi:hypothetical protein
MTCAIIAVPHQHARHACIQSRRHQERHAVLDFWIPVHRDNCITNDTYWQGEQHDDTTKSQTIRDDCDNYCEDSSYGIRDDRPELGLIRVVCKFKIVDDGWKEQAKGVEAGEDGKVAGCG